MALHDTLMQAALSGLLSTMANQPIRLRDNSSNHGKIKH